MDKRISAFKFENIRERFTVGASQINDSGWTKTKVQVFDNTTSSTNPIYEYERNYTMLDTFEPFRLWDEEKGQWRNFSLISPEYTNFEVLDLDNREIIAKNPPLIIDEERAELMNEFYLKRGEEPKYKVGDDISGWRFCPLTFHVPDVYDILTKRDIVDFKNSLEKNSDIDYWEDWMNNFLNRRTFGFEAGCVWGDDWSDKVQAIDLSKILQGEVFDDDRFGYFILQGALQDIYSKNYFDDEDYRFFNLNTPITFTFDDKNPAKVVKTELYGSDLPNFDYTE